MTSATPLSRTFAGRGHDAPIRRALWHYLRDSDLRALVLGASKDPNAKITILLVSPESGRPRLAVKAPTTAAAERAVQAEARLLRELDGLLPGRLRGTVPSVVNMVEFEGRAALVLTAVPGTPMTTAYLEWGHTRSTARVAADFAAVGAWIGDFQRATTGESAEMDMDGGVASRLQSRFSDEPTIDADLDKLAAIYERLRIDRVPRTFVHGDFWCGNLLRDRDRLTGVVDWEAASASGEPVRDLVRFALMYALYLDRRTRAGRRVAGHQGLVADSWGAGVAYALNGSGWFPELFRRFLRDGFVRLGASPESWRDAALAGIAEVAALTDDDAFARRHLQLFEHLCPNRGAPR
ncbi:MAG TPA: aminoglycoside phosphotransferase family protein [Gaiellaceae bacterium]|nr:aminoglycoside phosphotransferase family protein [Gaiellaceae bacterium]